MSLASWAGAARFVGPASRLSRSPVAHGHYLSTPEDHFRRTVMAEVGAQAAQNPAQHHPKPNTHHLANAAEEPGYGTAEAFADCVGVPEMADMGGEKGE